MLKVYGSDLCPDCRECKFNFDQNNVEYEYVDINEKLHDLAEFLKLRDSLPVFDHTKEVHQIGIPTLVDEDGTVFLDWEGYLKERNLPIVYIERIQGRTCSIDGEGC